MKFYFVAAAGLGHEVQREQLDPPCQVGAGGAGSLPHGPAAWASRQLSWAPDRGWNKLQTATALCPCSPSWTQLIISQHPGSQSCSCKEWAEVGKW